MRILIGLVVFMLVYYSGFTHSIVAGDDIWLYMSAPGGWERVRELFLDIGGTYRPIPFSLFSLYRLFEGNTVAMHWVPIVLHAVNVCLVYLVAFHWSRSKLGALTGTLVYGVSHTLFFDVFTLTGLVDQVFLLFGLGSIWMMLQNKITESFLLFILAMFSKESFVSVLLVLSYFLWIRRRHWQQWVLYWGPAMLYFSLKLGLYRQQGEAYSYIISLETLGRNLFDYGLWLINWRHGWQMGMPYEPHRYYDLVSALYGGGILLSAWRAWQKKRQLFWLPVWWGAVGLVPFYFLGRALPFYLAFSLVGVALIVAVGISVMKQRLLYVSLMISLTMYLSVTTKAQWVEHSFSVDGVEAVEKFRDQVVNRYDWDRYTLLCLADMDQYATWATGVGQAFYLLKPEEDVTILMENDGVRYGDCKQKNAVEVQYLQDEYRLRQ